MTNPRLYYYLIALIFTIHFIPGYAQMSPDSLAKKVDLLFAEIEGQAVPGSAVLVVKDGIVVLNKGYGLANLEHNILITPATVFDIASVSKQFAGFAIASLSEEGRISLKDNVRDYIPELPDFGPKITIEHLVYHTSGIRDWTGTLTMAGWTFDDVITFDQILRMAYNQKQLNFDPGTEYQYSNTGYNLLVEVIQRVTGLSFREWTTQNIFEPLGMNNSFFLDDLTEVIPNKANSYSKGKDGKFHFNHVNLIALGSSSLNTTTEDLAKWVINLDNKAVGGESVINRMFQRGKLNNGESIDYAYGFWIGEYRGTPWIDHTGGWESFRTYMTYFPNEHLSIVVLNNNGKRPTNTALNIANFYIPETNSEKSRQRSSEKKKPKIKTKVLDEYVGTYKFGSAWYVHITREEANLYAQETSGEKLLITPISQTAFSGEEFGGNINFERNDSSKQVEINYNGKKRLTVKGHETLNSEQLSELEGKYYSEELKTSYTVIKDKNKISLNHFRSGKIELVHAWNDDFEAEKWLTKSIEFFRDLNGHVIGFKATEGGARNQIFYRITN